MSPNTSIPPSFIAYFPGAKSRGADHWMVRCPAHQDNTASLSIDLRDDKYLLKCFAGCETAAIMAAIHRPMSDLFTKPGPRPIGPPPKTTVYRIQHPACGREHQHRRTDYANGKSMPWRTGAIENLDGCKPTEFLFGWEALSNLPAGAVVTFTEGEKAAQALIDLGIPAVASCCGASTTPTVEALEALRGYGVRLWPDHDDDGYEHMERIGAHLHATGVKLTWVEWPDAKPKADAADADAQTARDLIAAATAWTPPPTPRPVDPALTAALDRISALEIENAALKAENDKLKAVHRKFNDVFVNPVLSGNEKVRGITLALELATAHKRKEVNGLTQVWNTNGAKRAGMSKSTVMRADKVLKDAGFLTTFTPWNYTEENEYTSAKYAGLPSDDLLENLDALAKLEPTAPGHATPRRRTRRCPDCHEIHEYKLQRRVVAVCGGCGGVSEISPNLGQKSPPEAADPCQVDSLKDQRTGGPDTPSVGHPHPVQVDTGPAWTPEVGDWVHRFVRVVHTEADGRTWNEETITTPEPVQIRGFDVGEDGQRWAKFDPDPGSTAAWSYSPVDWLQRENPPDLVDIVNEVAPPPRHPNQCDADGCDSVNTLYYRDTSGLQHCAIHRREWRAAQVEKPPEPSEAPTTPKTADLVAMGILPKPGSQQDDVWKEAMRDQPPTDRQLRKLSALRYRGPIPEDKYTASDLIDALLKKKDVAS